ncbi:MAG: ATP-binding cassette domain-containing protein [Lachnospiraceae bacterium]
MSLTVNKKEKVCIVGETGSGKSILLLAILHLLPENAIVTGKAFFEGRT